MSLEKANKIVELLNELKRESPDFEVTIDTMNQYASCRIGKAKIYLSGHNELVIDVG